MPKQFINPPNMKPLGKYSTLTVAQGGSIAFVSGQVSVDGDGKVVGAGDIDGDGLDDVIISSVKAVTHCDVLDQRVRRDTQKTIADQSHRHLVAQSNFISLVFDRTGVRIDQDLDLLGHYL